MWYESAQLRIWSHENWGRPPAWGESPPTRIDLGRSPKRPHSKGSMPQHRPEAEGVQRRNLWTCYRCSTCSPSADTHLDQGVKPTSWTHRHGTAQVSRIGLSLSPIVVAAQTCSRESATRSAAAKPRQLAEARSSPAWSTLYNRQN